MDISGLVFMTLWEKYFASSAVEYRIEVRLSDCAIRRSLSLLSLLPVALRLVIRVLAAVHVEVVGIASERTARVERFFTFLSIFSLSTSRIIALSEA